jgi:xylulokinase
MTGVVLTEPSDASATLLYDVPGERWDTDVIEALGLDQTLFAPLASWSGDPAGALTSRAAGELGLAPGIQVAAGAGDTAAAMFGSGLHVHGSLQLTLGSGGQIVSAVDEAVRRGRGTTLFRTAARHGWYVMAATTNAGLALDWVRTVLAASWEELYAAAASPGAETDPLFLPHLTGERTPWLDTTMRGAWVGLALAHDRTACSEAPWKESRSPSGRPWMRSVIAARRQSCASPAAAPPTPNGASCLPTSCDGRWTPST